jgi:secernin
MRAFVAVAMSIALLFCLPVVLPANAQEAVPASLSEELEDLISGSYSCDTWVVMKDASNTGRVMFGKNSDRLPFDCQPLMYHPRQVWTNGSTVRLEYIEIPQVNVTYATIGTSPYWCYGYEMGVNEYGVVTGNEAIWTTSLKEAKSNPPQRGLTGMDLLRLGLERGKTAYEVITVITQLLEKYGQWGSGEPTVNDEDGSYDNSFLVADSNEAWVLENAGKEWVAKRITTGTRSISNAPSIGGDWDEGTLPLGTNFKLHYSDFMNIETLSGITRQKRSSSLLYDYSSGDGVTLREMMAIAREHKGSIPGICMHQIPLISPSQTAGSLIVVLPNSDNELIEIWWTPSLPCKGIYVPLFIDANGFPDILSRTGKLEKSVSPAWNVGEDEFSMDSYWWLFKKASESDMDSVTRETFDNLEIGFENELNRIREQTLILKRENRESEAAALLGNFSEKCVDSALSMLLKMRLPALDTEPPTIANLLPADGGITYKRPTFSANFSDNIKVKVAMVEVYLDDINIHKMLP